MTNLSSTALLDNTRPALPILGLVSLLSVLLMGCGQEESYVRIEAPTNSVTKRYAPEGFFRTPYWNESAAQVTETLMDLAEMSFYGQHHTALSTNQFQLRVVEQTNSVPRHPTYDVEFQYQGKTLKQTLKVDQIAAPATYHGIASSLHQWFGGTVRSQGPDDGAEGLSMLDHLLEGTSAALEEESQRVSEKLTEDFRNAGLHERAAFLCGLMVLRENAGRFFDTRHSLRRTVAHLAFANALGGTERSSAGRLAEVICLLGMWRQADALAEIDRWGGGNARTVGTWLRVLKMRTTGDYRLLTDLKDCRRAERIAWFRGFGSHVNQTRAWQSLPEPERYRVPDYLRYLPSSEISVELGHETTPVAIKREFEELESIHEKYFRGEPLPNETWKTLINEPPSRCISPRGDVRVISWGAWAWHCQRQLCSAISSRYHFLERRWNVHDMADEFSRLTETTYHKLALYPFLIMQSSTNLMSKTEQFERAMDALASMPQVIPSPCWSTLTSYREFPYQGREMPRCRAAQTQWFHHYPLPGTALLAGARLSEALSEPDGQNRALAEELVSLAPYHFSLIQATFRNLYPKAPPPELVERWMQPLSTYSTDAMLVIASSKRKLPGEYEKWVTKAAELNPANYLKLYEFYRDEQQPETALRFLEKGYRLMDARVAAGSAAHLLIDAYLERGEVTLARKVADEAAEVYSWSGLKAKSRFHERQGELETAFTWLQKLEERYGDSEPLIQFAVRHAPANLQTQFGHKLMETVKAHRPKDLPQVTLAGLTAPPTNGVAFASLSTRLTQHGFLTNDVIVAVGGLRIRDTRDLVKLIMTQIEPELELILWDGKSYRELRYPREDREFDALFYNFTGH